MGRSQRCLLTPQTFGAERRTPRPTIWVRGVLFLWFDCAMMRVLGNLARLTLLVTGACTLTPSSQCDHGAADDGACCPAWAYPSRGRCSLRRWSLPTGADGFGQQAGSPSVDIDRSGRAWLAFGEGFYGGTGVVVARETSEGWNFSSPSAGYGGYNSDPKIAVVDDTHAILVWQRSGYEGGDSSDEVRVGIGEGRLAEPPGGGQFSFPPYAYQHKVLAHADGELFVTWNQALDAGLRRGVCIANRHEGETAFRRPTSAQDVVSRSLIYSNNPEVSRNERGDMVVAWYESIGEKLRVMVSERTGLEGHFTHAFDDDALSPPETDVENPEPAVAEDGRAAVVWRQLLPNGRMAVFLAERAAGGEWARPSIDQAFSAPVDLAWNTRVAYARTGDLYIAWEQKVAEDWSVMVAHRDASGRWLASGTDPLRLSNERAIAPVLRVAPDGSVVVLWQSYSGSRWRVLARRSAVDAEGLREVDRWSSAVSLSVSGGDASGATLAVARDATASGHRFLAAWSQDGRIYTSSLD
jgi:hypothetical protein